MKNGGKSVVSRQSHFSSKDVAHVEFHSVKFFPGNYKEIIKKKKKLHVDISVIVYNSN